MTYAMRLNGGQLIQDGEGVKHDGFTVNVIADGTGFGNPEPLVKTLNTLMTQGSWETLGQPGNRAPALVIEVEGETPDGLNAGEVWLSKLMGSGALEWLPPDQTVWTVFDVVWSYIDRTIDERWDLDETSWVRYYRIPIKALPYARSPELTVTPADAESVDTVLTDGTSTSGFTASYWRAHTPASRFPITPAVVSGRVRASRTTTGESGDVMVTLRYQLPSPPTSGKPYIRIDRNASGGGSTTDLAIVTNLGRVPLAGTANIGVVGVAGEYYYYLPAGTEWVESTNSIRTGQSPGYFEIDQIRYTSYLPPSATKRQKHAAIVSGGSAPAEGSLHVGHASAGLGKVVLYTYPLGRPSPALMQYRTAGTTETPDTSTVNGKRTLIQAADLVMTVPDALLPTRGLAAVWAKLQVDTAPATVRLTVTPTTGGLTVGQVQTKGVVVPVGTVVLVPLGLVTLPGAVTGADGATVVKLRNVAGTGIVSVDEVWACGVDDLSALTILDAGAGTPVSGGASNHMWIHAPSADRPAGEVLIGTNPADARWPAVVQAGPQVHKFAREGVSVMAVTCSAADSMTDLTHFKRWTHHAAENS